MKNSSLNSNLFAINYKQLYESTKKRMNLESKQIKKLLLYNYLNDSNITTILFNYIQNDNNKNKDNFSELEKIKSSFRLILILNNNTKLTDYKNISNFIKNNDNINSIYYIYENEYNIFLSEYKNIFNITNLNFNNFHYPFLILSNKILYLGNFINSKNKKTINDLNIKSVISLMTEKDKDLENYFGDNNYRNFYFDESNHSELDFNEILDYIFKLINNNTNENNNLPILIYCFSGKTASITVCAAFLMKYKKWTIEFSIGYLMKIISSFENIPSWLYMQLMKLKEKNK